MPKKTTKKKTTKKPATKKVSKKAAKKKAPAKRHAANNKTQKTRASVPSYLKTLPEDRKADCTAIHEMMKTITKDDGSMWGPSIAGYGHTHLVYETGREMDWFLVGFSSRKAAITLYVLSEFETRDELLAKLGPHKHGKGCLYIMRLSDIHIPTLKKLIRDSCKAEKKRNTP